MKTGGCWFIIVITCNQFMRFLRLKKRSLNLAHSNKKSTSYCKELLKDDGMTR